MILANDDQIITAWATSEAGPGWSNTPIWVLVREPSGKLRIECLQPDEQTGRMMDLHIISAIVQGKLIKLVEGLRH